MQDTNPSATVECRTCFHIVLIYMLFMMHYLLKSICGCSIMAANRRIESARVNASAHVNP